MSNVVPKALKTLGFRDYYLPIDNGLNPYAYKLNAVMEKPLSFYAFEILYWCGIREGELLALTSSDFDFAGSSVFINKSYQRLNGQDIITTPKTKKSNRIIKMPQFLCE